MKKYLVVSIVVALVVVVLGSAALAQAGTVGPAETKRGFGTCGGNGYRAAGGGLISIVADLTGMSVEDIARERADGKSLLSVAQEKGITKEKLVEKALAERKEWLDSLVEEGVITEEAAQARLTLMEERILQQLERTAVGPAGFGRGFGGKGMGRGQGSGRCPYINTN